MYTNDRLTIYDELIRSASKINQEVSPCYYKPNPLSFKKESAKVKGCVKQKDERIFLSDESATAGQMTPGAHYSIPRIVSLILIMTAFRS